MKNLLPFCVGLRINFLISIASGSPLACLHSCIAVEAEEKSSLMDVIDEVLNSGWKLLFIVLDFLCVGVS